MAEQKKMAGQEKRISVRTKRAIKFGRRTVRIQVAHREGFTVHEDLLCNKSEFFCKKLQPKRKPFDDNTDCNICTEKLKPGVKELTHCTAHCGNNFHYKCMERWKDEKRAAGQTVKCPFCRHNWAVEDNMITVHRFPNLNATAFSIFTDFLYHNRIALRTSLLESNKASQIQKPSLRRIS